MQSRIVATLGVSLALALGAFSFAAQAEKRDLTYVKTYSKSISKSTVVVEDVPNHEVLQEVLLQQSKYSGADFSPTEEWIHVQTDQTDGSGTHKGYFFMVLEGGDQAYGTFDGRHKTLNAADGAWSSTWEGSYRYLGGTGKYKRIKGTGTYHGRASPKEPFHEEGRETIEY